jgi:hypothetical protein
MVLLLAVAATGSIFIIDLSLSRGVWWWLSLTLLLVWFCVVGAASDRLYTLFPARWTDRIASGGGA